MENTPVTKGGEPGEESRILSVVQAIAMRPAEASELASRHLDRFRKARPKASEREVREAVSRAIVERYARLAATSGGLTALAGVVPGVGTAAAMLGGGAADAAICMKLQVDMSMCLAAAFDWDLTSEDARQLTYLLAAGASLEKFGVERGVQLASKAGVSMLRQYLTGAALETAKQAFKRVGVTFTRTALEKAFPFGVGVAISSGANYALTRYVGATATKWFMLDAELADSADNPALDEPLSLGGIQLAAPGEGGPALLPGEAPAP